MTRGGARPGAGRPAVPRDERTIPVAVSMPRSLRDELREEADGRSVSALIVGILRRRKRRL